jgi:hypothetical protein
MTGKKCLLIPSDQSFSEQVVVPFGPVDETTSLRQAANQTIEDTLKILSKYQQEILNLGKKRTNSLTSIVNQLHAANNDSKDNNEIGREQSTPTKTYEKIANEVAILMKVCSLYCEK